MQESKSRTYLVILVATTTLFWFGTVKAQAPYSGESNVSGRWQGTRTTTGGIGVDEYKVHSIRFDLKQRGEDLSGSYKCYAGKKANADCNNPVGTVTAGKIKQGNIDLKVQAEPNDLSCSFAGSIAGNRMNGSYTCYVGGTLASNGVWQARRR
jgi:hypothetical protein